MKLVKSVLMFVFVGMSSIVTAQTDTSTQAVADSIIPKKNSFTADLNYQSRLHYFGRTDDSKSSGLFPVIGYELKQGFYAKSNFIFINNASNSFDYNGTVLEAGYKFPEGKHFAANVFYSQFLYKDQSELVQSALKSQTGINVAYNNKIVNVNLGGDAKFSDKTDFGATAGLDHLFLHLLPGKKIKKAIAFNPSAYVYAGTQNFSNTYIVKNRGLGVINLPVQQGPRQQTVTESGTKFNILAYEFSAPVVFVFGKFNASVTPSYVLPQNLIKVPSRPELSENGTNMFYVSASIGITL